MIFMIQTDTPNLHIYIPENNFLSDFLLSWIGTVGIELTNSQQL